MSQLGADQWVLSHVKTPGYFLDVGAHDGEKLSNTVALEKHGWHGLCIDPFPLHFEKRKHSIVHKGVMWDTANVKVQFIHHSKYPSLSGVREALGKHKRRVENGGTVHTFRTELLANVLDKYQAPMVIDYMNLDIEGAELRVLTSFPFERYQVHLISVEHNFEEPKRTQIQKLLQTKGYRRVKKVKWDDWYQLKSSQS